MIILSNDFVNPRAATFSVISARTMLNGSKEARRMCRRGFSIRAALLRTRLRCRHSMGQDAGFPNYIWFAICIAARTIRRHGRSGARACLPNDAAPPHREKEEDPMSDIDANAYTLHYQTENCNCSDTIAFDGCNSVMTYDLDDMPVESQGRVLQLNAKVRNICPGRRTAVMISLHELDQYGNEQPRGMKAFTLPAHNENGCRDITLSKVRFVLPEDLAPASSSASSDASAAGNCGVGCGVRNFIARTFAHYIDSEYTCACAD